MWRVEIEQDECGNGTRDDSGMGQGEENGNRIKKRWSGISEDNGIMTGVWEWDEGGEWD